VPVQLMGGRHQFAAIRCEPFGAGIRARLLQCGEQQAALHELGVVADMAPVAGLAWVAAW